MYRIERAAEQSYFSSCHKLLASQMFAITGKYYRENYKTSTNKMRRQKIKIFEVYFCF
jgi:hypothetical protein